MGARKRSSGLAAAVLHGPSARPWLDRFAGDGGVPLAALIEGEIIPRLLQDHPEAAAHPSGTVAAHEVGSCVRLCMEEGTAEVVGHACGLSERGVSAESLLLELFTPAARELGRLWEEDLCDFVAVTAGLCCLQDAVHQLAGRAGPGAQEPEFRALFSPMPGDQHGFGALVVEEVFARSGWATERLIEPTGAMLVSSVRNGWFDLAGLTVSCDVSVPAVAAIVASLREASRNPRLAIMVGGPLFAREPALADAVGADGTASDALFAVRVARTLVSDARSLNVAQIA